MHAVCYQRTDTRSKLIAHAMHEGILRCGDKSSLVDGWKYENGRPTGDVAVFYGYKSGGKEIFADYLAAGKHIIFIDLGYWGRRHGGRYTGFHRFSVDSRHPSKLVMKFKLPPDRLDVLKMLHKADTQHPKPQGIISKDTGLEIKPWRKQGDIILLAGMQKKSCDSYKVGYMEWETNAVREIRKHTDRPIIYRPKPHDQDARPLEGTEFCPPDQFKLPGMFKRAWCVVTHHSNVGADALIEGIPVFSYDGLHRPLALDDFSRIESPLMPADEERQRWLNAAAYFQYSIPEMREGVPWRTFKELGLLG